MAHEEAFVLRNKLDELARNVANSDLVVMTLGLTETWFDISSKVAFNGLNVVAINHRRATTAFLHATVAQVIEVITDALENLIERNTEVAVAVTFSPVPLSHPLPTKDVMTT